MKKVLFHYPIFNTGGAEMSVLRLTRILAARGWDVELVLTTKGGHLESSIDPRVKISHLCDAAIGAQVINAKGKLHKLCLGGLYLLPYIYYRLQRTLRSIPYLFKHYDAAIISLGGLSPEFCCRWVRAEKRLQWIRSDLSLCDLDGKAARNIHKYHTMIDCYVCVSGTARDSLVALYPDLTEKSVVLYNVIDAKSMREMAENEPNPYIAYGDALKVLTVCRLYDKAKGLFRMLDIHKRLIDEGILHYWFVVGDGEDRDRMLAKVQEYGLEETFILVGHRDNPFPYYKHADVSAALSYYEGLCGAVNEAKVMGKPVIATDFSGIREQITDGEGGLIVANDTESIYNGMKRILTDSSLREKLTNNILPQSIMDDEYKIKLLEDMI